MKTQNAFALKNFDAAKILQRPFFKKWREDYHVGDKPDKEILSKIFNGYDVETFEAKNFLLSTLHSRLVDLQGLIMRHANNRLEPYRRAVQKKMDAVDADVQFLQAKVIREQNLMMKYIMDVSAAVGDLIVIVQNLWQDSEQELQAAYRRRFGERLKIARERAGLSRKELGDAINISPNGYGLYETGKRDVSTTALIRLARTLNVSADWLIGLTP